MQLAGEPPHPDAGAPSAGDPNFRQNFGRQIRVERAMLPPTLASPRSSAPAPPPASPSLRMEVPASPPESAGLGSSPPWLFPGGTFDNSSIPMDKLYLAPAPTAAPTPLVVPSPGVMEVVLASSHARGDAPSRPDCLSMVSNVGGLVRMLAPASSSEKPAALPALPPRSAAGSPSPEDGTAPAALSLAQKGTAPPPTMGRPRPESLRQNPPCPFRYTPESPPPSRHGSLSRRSSSSGSKGTAPRALPTPAAVPLRDLHTASPLGGRLTWADALGVHPGPGCVLPPVSGAAPTMEAPPGDGSFRSAETPFSPMALRLTPAQESADWPEEHAASPGTHCSSQPCHLWRVGPSWYSP